jgi:hypothetical protein
MPSTPRPLTLEDLAAIQDLRDRFVDAANLRNYDAFADLFADDGVWEIPDMQAHFRGRATIRVGIEQMLDLWTGFVQLPHGGPVTAADDGATGRVYVQEFGTFRRGGSQTNTAFYDDRYVRGSTPEGAAWRFARRAYHVLYVDETPLAGRMLAPPARLRRADVAPDA